MSDAEFTDNIIRLLHKNTKGLALVELMIAFADKRTVEDLYRALSSLINNKIITTNKAKKFILL